MAPATRHRPARRRAPGAPSRLPTVIREPTPSVDAAPDWYRDAVIYELHVRAFCDSNGDGIGDFRGPDRQARLPARPRRHGDLAAAVLPVAAARRRLRHRRLPRRSTRPTARCATSSVFLARGPRARPAGHHRAGAQPHLRPAPVVPARAPGARRAAAGATSTSGATRPSATRTRASSSRTSRRPTGRGTRSPAQYYWHRFYSHQPDLNFDNPEVRSALMFSVVDFWLEHGRRRAAARRRALPLRARGHELREPARDPRLPAASCAAHVDERYPDRMLLAEANQWPEDAAAYFGDGDECHMAFHFPLMPRLFMAIQHGGPLPDHRHPRSRPRRSPTAASGRSSCATTTS